MASRFLFSLSRQLLLADPLLGKVMGELCEIRKAIKTSNRSPPDAEEIDRFVRRRHHEALVRVLEDQHRSLQYNWYQ